jgi:HAAS
MFEKLDTYLEEISHYLAGRAEREEILNEIRSHILEKAEREFGAANDAASIDKVIAAYGPARRVAEKYLDGMQPIIAPAYKRYLFRYTSFLFALHALLTVVAVVFKKSFIMFPFIFMPRLGVLEAIMYLPTAFLTDLGVVALVLYFITQSGKEFRLPWPKFAVDLDEVKPPAKGVVWEKIALTVGTIIMLAVTDFALALYVKHHTIFFVNLDWHNPRPLLTPEVGQRLSLIVIAMFASWTLAMFAKVLFSTRWVDVVSGAVSLALIGLLLRQPFDNPFAVSVPAAALPKIRFALTFMLLFIALMTTIDLVKNLIRIGRKRLQKS